MHRIAAVLAVPAAVWLALRAPAGEPRAAVSVFGAAIVLMFTISATVHARRWPPVLTEVLFRLDHTAIFIAIAGTATPIAVLGLTGVAREVLLWGVWGIAGLGIVVVWLPFAPPRGFGNAAFLTMSWLVVFWTPSLLDNAGWDTLGWLIAGGIPYTVGAIIVGLQRPDPWPEVFGYHEIWHALVIVAVICHYVMFSATLLPPPV